MSGSGSGRVDVAESVGTDEWRRRFGEFVAEWREMQAHLVPDEWHSAFARGQEEENRLRSLGDWVSGPASLMGVLGIRSLEVPHSRILAWLLDPAGRHGLGDTLLRTFLTAADPTHEFDTRSVLVAQEVVSEDEDAATSRYVDVVARGAGWTLVIENKMWAGQHGPQLDVYFDAHQGPNTYFIYLTPFGRRARSPLRLEVEQAWIPMSWRTTVLPALRAAVGGLATGDPVPLGLAAVSDYVQALEEELR